MVNDDGLYPYIGGGVGLSAFPITGSITYSDTPPVPGWNLELQGSLLFGGGIGDSFGTYFTKRIPYGEFGFGFPPGYSLTVFHVWEISW